MGLTGPQSCQVQGCDKSWERHPILETTCPQCGADVGENCKRPSGHQPWGEHGRFHTERYYEALDEGHFGECPKNRCPESSATSKRRKGQESEPETTTEQKTLPV